MKEIFVLYDKGSGFKLSSGRIDREWDMTHKDGSTRTEWIERTLSKNPNREVIYLPDQFLPDPKEHKIKNGKIVELTKKDKEDIEAAKPKSEIELLEERVAVLEAQ